MGGLRALVWQGRLSVEHLSPQTLQSNKTTCERHVVIGPGISEEYQAGPLSAKPHTSPVCSVVTPPEGFLLSSAPAMLV